MASRHFAICALLLSACSPAQEEESGDLNAPVVAAASEQAQFPSYYPAGYAEMKAAAAIFAKENFDAPMLSESDDHTGDKGEFYLIEDCQSWAENAEIGEPAEGSNPALEDLARRIAKHQHNMAQLYPSEAFEGPLRDYERRAIEHLAQEPPEPGADDYESPVFVRYQQWQDQDWKMQETLAKAIEERRLRLAPNTHPVRLGGGCGAGEVAYLVSTRPADGRLWMTTKFSFDLCRARKLDPWNTDACRWSEVSPSEPVYLAGRYVYQAKWRDGVQRRAVRAFDGYLDPEKGDTINVVISAP